MIEFSTITIKDWILGLLLAVAIPVTAFFGTTTYMMQSMYPNINTSEMKEFINPMTDAQRQSLLESALADLKKSHKLTPLLYIFILAAILMLMAIFIIRLPLFLRIGFLLGGFFACLLVCYQGYILKQLNLQHFLLKRVENTLSADTQGTDLK